MVEMNALDKEIIDQNTIKKISWNNISLGGSVDKNQFR